MYRIDDLKQMYYCSECEEFYEETSFRIEFRPHFKTDVLNCRGKCPKEHLRKDINIEKMIYLPEKPIGHPNSSIIYLDMKKFSEKDQISQFSSMSLLNAVCMDIISNGFKTAIYKGTGDGFVVGLPSFDVSKAIEFCEMLIMDYLNHINFISYRIGIDYGLFFSYIDLNERKDLMGKLVIDVARISDFGNGENINHVLLSDSAAINLNENDEIRKANLKELGICLAKHRSPYKIYNYQSESIGAEYKLLDR